MPKAIEFYKLTEQFYVDNKDNTQILFNKGGRGYGVILVKILGCDFAIPLHSNIKKGFILGINQETGIKHGLDYLKAICITDKTKYIGDRYYLKERQEFNKINNAQKHIIQEFEKFVKKYIKAVQEQNENILRTNYRNTTLVYYHHLLGITTK
ncbi:hypothetical protein NYR61_01845 [Actinobacillus genomosp. 1]|uniref:type III toxin-antitoxin system TenpIN family toxin n=1 Tax=Actinobacillus genomosp. 1 TaxID=254839 RepID=UPI002441508D|nr:hypothetical protein [Actinobacillus genomosp. 1]WGE34324.1 hypothetical protein NYR61_01845 [Actinobacillus genomosp. 1]